MDLAEVALLAGLFDDHVTVEPSPFSTSAKASPTAVGVPAVTVRTDVRVLVKCTVAPAGTSTVAGW